MTLHNHLLPVVPTMNIALFLAIKLIVCEKQRANPVLIEK